MSAHLTHMCLCPGVSPTAPTRPFIHGDRAPSPELEFCGHFTFELAVGFPATAFVPTLGGAISLHFPPSVTCCPHHFPPHARVQVAAPPPGRAFSPSPGLLPTHTCIACVVSALGNSGVGMNPGSLQPLPRGHLVGLFPVAHFSRAVPVFSDSQSLRYFPWEIQTPRCQKIQLANAS